MIFDLTLNNAQPSEATNEVVDMEALVAQAFRQNGYWFRTKGDVLVSYQFKKVSPSDRNKSVYVFRLNRSHSFHKHSKLASRKHASSYYAVDAKGRVTIEDSNSWDHIYDIKELII